MNAPIPIEMDLSTKPHQPATSSERSLDAVTFFLADVQDGLGPYLAIYLTSHLLWQPQHVGMAMAAMVVGTLIAQIPAGALIDRTRFKRLAVMIAAGVVACATLLMITFPQFGVILFSQAVTGAAAAIMPPAIAGISLGMVGAHRMAKRVGRNEGFNHAGNVTAAVLAGVLGTFVGYEAIFFLVAGMAIASAISVSRIREQDIDHEQASANADGGDAMPIRELLHNWGLIAFIASIFIFHFANAAMLPLVGQKVSKGNPDDAAALMSACIIAAQLVMIPVAVFAGRFAETWGRKPLFLIAFAVLPIRGLLYTVSTNSVFLVSVQLLDGIGAGVYGVVGVLVMADLTRGTGRFNLGLGVMATASGLGAASSNLMTGVIVQHTNFDTGFVFLAMMALIGLIGYRLTVRETIDREAPPVDSERVPQSIAD